MVTCDQCDGECCRDVTVELDEPEDMKDWEDIRWMVAHENVSVYLDNEDDWVVEFRTPCTQLDKNNKCKIYNKRPDMCKNHEEDNCVKNGEGDVHKLKFDTIEEVDEYIEKVAKPKIEYVKSVKAKKAKKSQ
ncbi:MAG: YkgJ family cysteine cluster protein [archaeon]